MNTETSSQNHIDSALNEFKGCIFSHPIAKDTFTELRVALGANASPKIIIFTGPTGVGKTTLTDAVCSRVNQYYQQMMIADPGFVPVVSINAVPPSSSGFSWKDFHTRLLAGQKEPLIAQKRLIGYQESLFPDDGRFAAILNKEPADVLRRSTEEYLKHRRTKLLVIDEAHHLLLMGSQQRLECQFECLKSLTIETGVTILLTGTYRLLDILDQTGQLTRRSQVVNFPRYDLREKTDRNNFRKVLKFFEEKLSKYVPTDLESHAEYFYMKSAGCIGILKDWLARCLEYALLEYKPLIDRRLAEPFAHKNRGLVTIVKEACIGEAKLLDVDDTCLQDLLKNGVLLESHKSPTSSRRRPGQRNPKRDPVGEAFA